MDRVGAGLGAGGSPSSGTWPATAGGRSSSARADRRPGDPAWRLVALRDLSPASPAAPLPIRLVALDIDGTLVGEDAIVGERTMRAVRAAMGRGVLVIVATGRMPSSAMGFVQTLGIRGPLIAYQGALIRADPDPAHARRPTACRSAGSSPTPR